MVSKKRVGASRHGFKTGLTSVRDTFALTAKLSCQRALVKLRRVTLSQRKRRSRTEEDHCRYTPPHTHPPAKNEPSYFFRFGLPVLLFFVTLELRFRDGRSAAAAISSPLF